MHTRVGAKAKKEKTKNPAEKQGMKNVQSSYASKLRIRGRAGLGLDVELRVLKYVLEGKGLRLFWLAGEIVVSLISIGGVGSGVSVGKGERDGEEVFPLEIGSREQYNLLYGVSFLQNPDDTDGFF
jgi:hypothetical protein